MMNELVAKSNLLHEVTEEECEQLKAVLLGMYEDINTLCQEHGITPILGGGNVLGAVRHGGFIPWDDDLDLMMLRDDYERFKQLCVKGEFAEKYEVTFPDKYRDTKNLFLKVYKRGTVCGELLDLKNSSPKGIFVDVFPIDYVSKNTTVRWLKGLFLPVLMFLCNSLLIYKVDNERYRQFMCATKYGRYRYRLRKIVGWSMSVFSHRWLSYCIDRLCQSERNECNLVTIPTGRRRYNGAMSPYDVFFPARKMKFCSMDAFVPNDTHRFLVSYYGENYMEVPPVEKRERHLVVHLKF